MNYAMKNNRMEEFYTFASKMSSTTVKVYPNLEQYVNTEGFPCRIVSDKLIMGNIDEMKVPLQYWIRGGRQYKDVLDTPWLSAYVISDRFRQILEDNNVTGWKSYPVELLDKYDKRISGYNGFCIVGRSGPMNPKGALGDMVGRVPDAELQPYKNGWFDVDTWDGSDIFLLGNSRWIIITERVYKLLKKEKVASIECVRVSDLTFGG